MKFLRKITPEWSLRIGLGLMYLYSGFDFIVNPQHWYSFVPKWFSQLVSSVAPIEIYLRAQGVGELILGILFLGWFFGRKALRLASLLAALEMLLILFFVGVDPITFRDIGLLGSSLALFVISSPSYGKLKI